GDDVDRACAASLVDQPGDGIDRALHRRLGELAGLRQTLSEPRDHRRVGRGVWGATGATLTEDELDRVGADVEDGEPGRTPTEELFEALGDTDVASAGQPESADGAGHQLLVGGLDGDGEDGPPVDADLGELDHAVVENRTTSALVGLHDTEVLPRADQAAQELLERVTGAP